MQKSCFIYYIFSILTLASTSCHNSEPEENIQDPVSPLFTLLPTDKTNIDFSNTLTEGLNTNVLMYEYFYNGGGVAVGDVNGDGYEDVYFTSNMGANKLYLNKEKMVFEDITKVAGVTGRDGPWKTGVTMADVNGDGLLDIYVCYSGNLTPEKRKNQLFVNQGSDDNGIPSFKEMAEVYGIAITSYSTQATFFDYDNDGDLDLFLLNHNPKSLPILDEATTEEILKSMDPAGSQLFRNDQGIFKETTLNAGISNSALSYGLGAGIADINGDGWMDIYICNDYTAPDFLYINNGNGTFTDKIQQTLGHTSHFSMGNDVADINNDGFPDIFTLDMLPEDNRRQKLLMAPDNYEKFDFQVRMGFHYQYMRNMLHINNGNGTFSEVGQLAGISNTDWSWSALFADYNNDGWKELFITNGFPRDFTNLDFVKYMGDFLQQNQGDLRRQDILGLVHQTPTSNVTNYMFQFEAGKYENVTAKWGLDKVSNSNGAVYGDLDNDGDLDLIVNNINLPAFIYQNETSSQTSHHYLKIRLEGEGKNTFGLGAKISLFRKGKLQYLEQMPTRGYQSSVSPILHAGLGEEEQIDSLKVSWLSGKEEVLTEVGIDQLIVLKEVEATDKTLPKNKPKTLYTEIPSPVQSLQEANTLNDFKRQPLMVNPISFSSPFMIQEDVNGDGLKDIFVGGSTQQPGKIFLQQKNASYAEKGASDLVLDQLSEDSAAAFFDANGDGYTDLYVCSGGYGNFLPEDPLLQDRLYLNDGTGNFTKQADALPSMLSSTSTVQVNDINGDGHPDLFIGGRVIPGRYPEIPQSYLLINDGQGKFEDMTANIAPDLQKAGMVTDAAWVDLNGDDQEELVLVGEWMPIRVFVNQEGKLNENTAGYFEQSYSGWWNALFVDDLNGDGKPDLLVGNQGLNTQVRASDQEPAEMFYKDYDGNGSVDPILCFYIQGKSYPYVTRDELLDQMAIMRTRFRDYESYAEAGLEDVFSKEELEGAGYLSANHLSSSLFVSGPTGKYQLKELPIEVQSSPVFAINTLDLDGDGKKDLILGGNIEQARLRFGKYDANYGLLLKGDGQGNFSYIPQWKSGFNIRGDVRSILVLPEKLLFGINQKGIVAYGKNIGE